MNFSPRIQVPDAQGRIDPCMAKYGKLAKEKVGKVMNEMKHGKLKNGKSGKKVRDPKQAIAIGLSLARKAGEKVPQKKR